MTFVNAYLARHRDGGGHAGFRQGMSKSRLNLDQNPAQSTNTQKRVRRSKAKKENAPLQLQHLVDPSSSPLQEDAGEYQ
jgi:hypothetical protein